jgi:hypothetical protein
MKNWRTFLAAAVGTTCLCLAGQFVQAGGAASKAAVPTGSTAIISDCEVSGKVERRDDGVYAVLTLASRSEEEATVEFNYAASCLPGRSMVSRMMVLPTVEKKGGCSYVVRAGETVTEAILLKKNPAKKGTAVVGADLWTLKIARGEINAKAGWGALNPAALGKKVELKDGQLVLATWQDKAAKPTSV